MLLTKQNDVFNEQHTTSNTCKTTAHQSLINMSTTVIPSETCIVLILFYTNTATETSQTFILHSQNGFPNNAPHHQLHDGTQDTTSCP